MVIKEFKNDSFVLHKILAQKFKIELVTSDTKTSLKYLCTELLSPKYEKRWDTEDKGGSIEEVSNTTKIAKGEIGKIIIQKFSNTYGNWMRIPLEYFFLN